MMACRKNLNPPSPPYQGGARGVGWTSYSFQREAVGSGRTTPPLTRGGREGLPWISP